MVRQVLADRELTMSDIHALAFAAGPGSFTGLRIATGVIQGLAWGLDVPVVPVSSLAAVALELAETRGGEEGDGIAVAFDARMDEVYWGCFRLVDGLPEPLMPERVCPPEQVSLPPGPRRWLAGGSGWRYAERMPEAVSGVVESPDVESGPDARFVARLAAPVWQKGGGVPAIEAQPVYLRDEVTWKKLPGR
jgi:tRNA threonylcarbamoyladenosine biosynthesis protein TsaB